MTFAPDLSEDLGFGRHMPAAFWHWCARRGLHPLPGRALAFDADQVRRALDKGV